MTTALLPASRFWRCWTRLVRQQKLSALYDGLPQSWGSPTMAPYCPDDKKYAVVEAMVREYSTLQGEGRDSARAKKIVSVVTVNGVRVTLKGST